MFEAHSRKHTNCIRLVVVLPPLPFLLLFLLLLLRRRGGRRGRRRARLFHLRRDAKARDLGRRQAEHAPHFRAHVRLHARPLKLGEVGVTRDAGGGGRGSGRDHDGARVVCEAARDSQERHELLLLGPRLQQEPRRNSRPRDLRHAGRAVGCKK